MGTLYCLPLGETRREHFIEEYKERGYKNGQAIFVLPSRTFINAAEEQGLLAGDFSFLAKAILKLAGVFASPMPPAGQRIIIASMLEKMQEMGRLEFFGGFSQSTGLAESLASLLREMARSGVRPDDLSSALAALSGNGAIRAKDREILLTYRGYSNFMETHGLLDMESALAKAAEVLRSGAFELPWKKVYISDFAVLTTLQVALVRALASRCEVDIGLVYRPEGEAYAASRKTYEELLGIGLNKIDIFDETVTTNLLRTLCTRLFTGGEKMPENTEQINVWKFANRRQEMQEITADVKKKILAGAQAEDFLLVVRNLSLYPGLRREFLLAGVPVSLPDSVKLYHQPLAHLLVDFLQAAAGNTRNALGRLFSSLAFNGCSAILGEQAKEALDSEFYVTVQEARLLMKKRLAPEAGAAEIDELFRFISSCPRQGTVEEYKDYLQGFLDYLSLPEKFGALYRAGVLDLAQLGLLLKTHKKMSDALKELADLYKRAGERETRLPAGRYAATLAQKMAEMSINSPGDRGGVRVVEASDVAGLSASYVYIFGLKEGDFPRLEAENWLYSDVERKNLSMVGVLADTVHLTEEDRLFFASSLAAARETMWLSFSITDGELLSSYIDEIMAIMPTLKIKEREAREVLPAVQSLVSEEILAAYLAGQTAGGLAEREEDWLAGYLGKDFFWRAGSELPKRTGTYDGFLERTSLLDLLHERLAQPLNASMLEVYAACPFRFLLEYIWRGHDWQESGANMAADVKGTLYHECLKRFLQPFLGHSLSGEKMQDLTGALDEVFEATVAEYMTQGRLKNTYLTALECASMLDKLHKWLCEEVACQQKNGFYPVQLEWEFGQADGALFLPGGARLRGRIDRIDSNGEQWFVTDYKTKNIPKRDAVFKGLDIQIPVYLLALDEFWGPPLGGGYFSVEKAKRGSGFWLGEGEKTLGFAKTVFGKQKQLPVEWEYWRGLFQDSLAQLIEKIAHGQFPPQPADGCPSYCPGISVCRFAKEAGEDDE